MPSTWGNGPPWRHLPGTLCCRCNISRAEGIKLSPCKPACPGATLSNSYIWAVGFFKNLISNREFAMPGLGQGSGPGNVGILEC